MEKQERPRAPGLKWRRRKSGPEQPIWVASVKGYEPRSANLSMYADDAAALVQRCGVLQREMLAWIAGKHRRPAAAVRGTFREAINLYQTDPESPYHALKPSSRHPYDIYLRKLDAHIGNLRIDTCDGRDVTRWFGIWAAPDAPGGKRKVAAARMAATVLKTVMRFGKISRMPGCADFKGILEDMEFESIKPRTFAPTAGQVAAARLAAHAAGFPLRALGYALQFETTLRQWDVFGQWIPMSDPRPSVLPSEPYGQKWIGPTWGRIDDDLILRVTPTKTEDTSEARIAIDLKLCPMVMEEIAGIPPERRSGPLVVFEGTGLPYREENLRAHWRRDFAAAGLPAGMWNRDLRAGGNTEGQQSGGLLEDRAKVTGHTKVQTTAEVYDRDVLEAHRRVARARVAFRGRKTD